MAISTQRFERVELKYWALSSQVPDIVRFAEPYVLRDPQALTGQRNLSVYLDTDRFTFFREHQEETPDQMTMGTQAMKPDALISPQ